MNMLTLFKNSPSMIYVSQTVTQMNVPKRKLEQFTRMTADLKANATRHFQLRQQQFPGIALDRHQDVNVHDVNALHLPVKTQFDQMKQ